MPQWRDIDVNFRGSGTAMGDALQQINTVAQVPGQLLKTIEEQKRYDAEQARQKVADERATTLFNQQQEDRTQQKAIRQGVLEAEQLKALLAPQEKNVVAFNDPRYEKALEQWKAQGNTDITESDKILSNYLVNTSQDSSAKQSILPSTVNKPVHTANDIYGSNGTMNNNVINNGTKVVTHYNPAKAGFVDPNATVKFGETRLIPTKQEEKPYSLLEAFTGRNNRVERPESSRLRNKLSDINAKYNKLLAPYQETLRNTSVMATGFTNNPSFNEAKTEAERLIRQRDQELYLAKTMPAPGTTPIMKPVRSVYESKISDINTTQMYNKDGTLIDASKRATSKTGDVFFKDSSNHLVNALTLGKAMQNAWKPGTAASTKTETIPSRTTVSKGEAAPLNLTMSQVSKIANKNSIPVEVVQTSAANVNADYTKFMDMLGKDNNKERDDLRQNMSAIAANLGLTPNDYDVNKAVDSILPSNELTGRQKLYVEASMKNLDAARDDYWKTAQYNLQKAEFNWKQQVKAEEMNLEKFGLSLKARQVIAAENEAKIPKGLSVVFDKDGNPAGMLPSEQAKIINESAAKLKTPQGKMDIVEKRRSMYDNYVKNFSSTGGLFGIGGSKPLSETDFYKQYGLNF